MKITRKQVEKTVISGIDNFDDITVIFEDYDEACGKTIIETLDGTWGYQWAGLAGRGMEGFFKSCGLEYLVNKLNPWDVNEEIDLNEGVHNWLRKGIVDCRREGNLTKDRARDLWDEIDWEGPPDDASSEVIGASTFPIFEIFGDDWYHSAPKRKNPKYEYLEKVVTHIRQALSEEDK